MNLYKQYSEVKKQHPDALVFYRVGDFYELFGQDAITASEALSLTLTSRDCGLPERVPMCGVPYHSVDAYLAKLVEGGYKTAICKPAKIEPIPKAADDPKGRINLTATGTEQTIIKEYLEANASDVLAEKINNGVRIQKDEKTLINKKTLETFLAYACEEARKLAEKGAKAAAVKSDTVFGWLIHYFEESSIEGTLYNEDGMEYKLAKPAPRTNKAKTTATTVTPKPKPNPQATLFDLMNWQTAAEEPKAEKTEIEAAADELELDEPEADSAEEPELDEPETKEPETDTEDDYPKGLHQISETEWADADGVVYEVTETKKEVAPDALTKLFGDLLIVR